MFIEIREREKVRSLERVLHGGLVDSLDKRHNEHVLEICRSRLLGLLVADIGALGKFVVVFVALGLTAEILGVTEHATEIETKGDEEATGDLVLCWEKAPHRADGH